MRFQFRLGLLLGFGFLISQALVAQVATHVVISEVYGGGGNSGATWKNDFIELHNPTDQVVSLNGWSVQYASAAGTSWQVTPLSGSIAPKHFYLVQEAPGSGGATNLPTPDAIGTIAMGAGSGKVALMATTAAASGSVPAGAVDFVGYGSANGYEGTGATAVLTNTTSAERKANSASTAASMQSGGADALAGNGYDSDDNKLDFVIRTPEPQNSSSPSEPAGVADIIPPNLVNVKALSPLQIEVLFNEPLDSAFANTPSNFTVDQGVSVFTADRDVSSLFRVVLSTSLMANGIYTLTITNARDATGNLDSLALSRSFSVGILTVAQARAAAVGLPVRVRGVVTVANEFKSPSFLQDSTAAIGVFGTSFSAGAKPGDLWEIAGVLKDFNGLLELDPLSDTIRISSGNPLPAPKVVTSAEIDGSLEGRLVRVNRVKFSLTGSFGTGIDSSYTGGDPSGLMNIRIDKDSNVPGSPIPADSVNIAGIVNDYYGTYRLMPRSIADIDVRDSVSGQTWTDMSVARYASVGTSVKVRGVVTFLSGTTHKTVYFQDYSGGLSVYDAKSDTLLIGDSVEVVGTMTSYQGLQELAPADSVTLLARGLPQPTPLPMLPGNAGEFYESRLVILHAVEFTTSGVFAVGTYTVTDGNTSVTAYVAAGSQLIGQSIPVGAMDLIGVLGQHTTSSGGYQILPRTTADFIQLPGPQIEALPFITALDDTSLTVSWTTLMSSNSILSFGKTKALGDSVVIATSTISHSVTLGGLTSGRIYYLRASSQDGSGTSTAPILAAVTTSSASSGSMSVYFNYAVDTTLGLLPKANGSVRLDQKLLQRIGAATKSIDFALYSFEDFGSNVNHIANPIADSLIAAKNRGVSVRMVTRLGYSSGPVGKLQAAGIPIMKRNVAELGSGMHSKFFVFDGRDTTDATDDWLVTGSWNVTNTGTLEDAQNAVFIQDQSVARIYEMEFEEMFGSSTDTPNGAAARFGPTKLDDSPHLTFIQGTKVEVYFSPSVHTTSQILRTIATADHDLLFALLTFTRNDLSGTAVAQKNAGASVHGLIDNINDNGSQFSFLQSSGADVRQASHSLVTGQFHHKYAVVDPFTEASDPTVVTGSHNWSSSAETDNDENTIIIHSGTLARQYAQEFSQRLREAGGTLVITGVQRTSGSVPRTTSLGQNYPNPFNPATTISYELASAGRVTLAVYDLLGREVTRLVEGYQNAGSYRAVWNAPSFPSGVYFVRLQADGRVQTKKALLVK